MPRKSRALKFITDGTSHTLMMSEMRTIKDFGNSWGGPISEIEEATGGQTFEGTLGPNDVKGDNAFRVACMLPDGTTNGCTEQTPIPTAARWMGSRHARAPAAPTVIQSIANTLRHGANTKEA